jgi:hypothetical protein
MLFGRVLCKVIEEKEPDFIFEDLESDHGKQSATNLANPRVL